MKHVKNNKLRYLFRYSILPDFFVFLCYILKKTTTILPIQILNLLSFHISYFILSAVFIVKKNITICQFRVYRPGWTQNINFINTKTIIDRRDNDKFIYSFSPFIPQYNVFGHFFATKPNTNIHQDHPLIATEQHNKLQL